jgi:predicted DNA-binding protein
VPSAKKPERRGKAATRRKTSIYLENAQREHLRTLAKRTGRPQAQLIREAIETYEPSPSANRNFALAVGFERIDSDPRPTSEIPDDDLLAGFGE